MSWTFDPSVDACYIPLLPDPGRVVSLDLSDAEVHLDIDGQGRIAGIEILANGTGAIARVLERYLKCEPERLEDDPH